MFVDLVFPLPFRNTFTYSVPEDLEHFIKIGVRAIAPFGKRTLTGFIVNTALDAEQIEKIKPIVDIIDELPVFDQRSLKFYEWLSEYYLSSLGEALRLAVPLGTEVESKKRIQIDTKYSLQLFEKEKNKNSTRAKILKVICEHEEISLTHLQKSINKKNIYSHLRTLQNLGAITIIDEIENARVKAKKVKYLKLNLPLAEIYSYLPEIETRSPKQIKILLELISAKGKPLPLQETLKKADAGKSSADSLVEKNLITIFDKEVERIYTEYYKEERTEFKLTDQQLSIVTEISNEISSERFSTFLLHGVTGSGKTQVYIELTKTALAANKTVLILVPEISLTPQMTSRLFNNFGDIVSVIHSRMSLGERFDSWRKILNSRSRVVVGARSALFAPLKNIGLICVDEEHDASYKQNDLIPRYNARDAAIILGSLNNCPVVLGSATPSIESMYNAITGKFKLVKLPERIDDAKMPSIKLVNVTIERKNKKMDNVFSKILLDHIEQRLKRKEGVIILQNRRGFSTQLYCDDCGELEICDNCSVPLVYHINKNILECHYCGLQKKTPPACTHCGSISLKYFGAGTERVEDELQFYFPSAKIKRVDSDAVSKKNTLGKILLEFSKGEIDILVGTQMVSKGLDFARVTLVGVISAETTLWLPDFRADERTFQLLTQVAGRAGRSKVEGEVVIQTQNEKNFTLQKVLQTDYKGFYEREIDDREKLGYPPFTRLALIETKDMDIEKAEGAINDFYKYLLSYKKQIKITSPMPAMIARLKGFYRFQLIIKSSRKTDPAAKILRTAVLNSLIEFNKRSRYKDVKILYDVDPQSIM